MPRLWASAQLYWGERGLSAPTLCPHPCGGMLRWTSPCPLLLELACRDHQEHCACIGVSSFTAHLSCMGLPEQGTEIRSPCCNSVQKPLIRYLAFLAADTYLLSADLNSLPSRLCVQEGDFEGIFTLLRNIFFHLMKKMDFSYVLL